MRAPGSTVVILAGTGVGPVLRGLGRLPNVAAIPLKDADSPGARDAVAAAHTPYLLHDADPLERVAASWVRYFDDPTGLSELDVEVELALAAFTRGDALLPDYYLVLGPEELGPTLRHWWLGVLATIAPTRVLPCPPRQSAVEQLLRTLPVGRAWPEPTTWLRDLKTMVPDRVGLL